MDRLSDNFSKLEIKQMKTIDNLQEEIKLLQFDKTNNGAIIKDLKMKLKIRDISVKSAINELEDIINNENYESIKYVLFSLKSSIRNQADKEDLKI